MVVELTDMGDRINARFVLHQMTLPGHYWRIVLKHTNTHLDFADPVDWRVFFEGTRLATGDSGYITVQQSFVDSDSWFVVMAAKARERQTGQLCRLAVDWAHGRPRPSGREPEQSIPPLRTRSPRRTASNDSPSSV
jgi:hypothetical protein